MQRLHPSGIVDSLEPNRNPKALRARSRRREEADPAETESSSASSRRRLQGRTPLYVIEALPFPHHRGMLLQPPFGLTVLRTQSLHLTPKAPRVIQLFHMSQFVQHDIVPHRMRHLHQTPIQRNRALPSTRAPPRTLVANQHPTYSNTVLPGQLGRSGRQLACCQFAKVILHFRPQVASRVSQANNLIRKSNEPGVAVHSSFERNRDSAKQDFGSQLPAARLG